MTLATGLIGDPISHSLSPAIHNAAYAALGLDWHYSLYDGITPEDVPGALVAGKLTGLVGLNVTTPYKVRILSGTCGAPVTADALASRIGAANTLVFNDGPRGATQGTPCDGLQDGLCAPWATNTDGLGIVASLIYDGGVEVRGASVRLYGTGPTSAAAFVALDDAGCSYIYVVSRDKTRANDFIARLAPVHASAIACTYDDMYDRCRDAKIIVNATPRPSYEEGAIVLNTSYANSNEATMLNGLGMLVEQAACSIEVWFKSQGIDIKAPRGLMRQAILDAI
jgi:shikimate dehydrogenase